MKKINLLYQPDIKQQNSSTYPQIPTDFNNTMLFANGTTHVGGRTSRRSPTSDCPSPSFEHLERKLKKPLMEKKRRKRINNCYDKLKEILMHSELQQSKLEKADVLEKTILFVRHLQQKYSQLQQQNQLLVGTEAGQQFKRGVDIAIAATLELLAGLQPELCRRVELEVPERVARAVGLGVPPNGNNTIPFIPPPIHQGRFIQQVNQQIPNVVPPLSSHSFRTSIFPNNSIQKTSFPYFHPFFNFTSQQQQRAFINSKYFLPCSVQNSSAANLEKAEKENGKVQIPSNATTSTTQPKNEEEENEEEVDVESLSTNTTTVETELKDNQVFFDQSVDTLKIKNKIQRTSRKNVWRPY